MILNEEMVGKKLMFGNNLGLQNTYKEDKQGQVRCQRAEEKPVKGKVRERDGSRMSVRDKEREFLLLFLSWRFLTIGSTSYHVYSFIEPYAYDI